MRRPVAMALVVLMAGIILAATVLDSAAAPRLRPPASGPPNGGGGGWQPGMHHAERYAKRRAGEVSFAVIDLDGRMRSFHGSATAPAASVFKVILLAAYLRQPTVRDRHLHPADRELLAPMIRRSDNEAATRVRDIVGRGAIERLARAVGMRDFTYSQVWGLSRTSARDQVRFMYHLGRYLPKHHRRYARHLLSGIVPSQRWGIAEVKPRGWKLFFKGGWGTSTGRVDHQVAFLKDRRRRIAVAILTEFDPSHSYGMRTLKGVARRLLRGLPRLPRRF